MGRGGIAWLRVRLLENYISPPHQKKKKKKSQRWRADERERAGLLGDPQAGLCPLSRLGSWPGTAVTSPSLLLTVTPDSA